jgi:hypothetical protein
MDSKESKEDKAHYMILKINKDFKNIHSQKNKIIYLLK